MIAPWKRKLRMGMVGGGRGAFIGAVHRTAAALDGQAELVAGCFSTDPANTRDTGRQLYLDPARCYSTYEEMASMEAKIPATSRIDFVSIVTPTVSHYAIAELFLRHGFHVLCDKPMTFSLEEAEKLVDLVQETGLVFSVSHNYCGYPLVRQARDMIRAGEIGVVRKVIVEYLQDFLVVPQEHLGNKQAAWRLDPARVGVAGTMGEAGVHAFHLLEYITGDPIAELCADRTTFLPGRVLEEDANILLRLAGGGRGVLTVSQIAAGEENNLSIRIYGSTGSLLWRQEQPNELEFYRFGESRRTLKSGHREYLSAAANQSSRIPAGHPEGYIEAFANIYDGFFAVVRCHVDGAGLTDINTAPTAFDGLRGIYLVTKAVESCNAGSVWIETRRKIEP